MEPLSPASQPSTGTSPNCAQDWSLGDHHQAKRARVEDIIRGMAVSPSGHHTGEGKTSSLEEVERKQENKRKQRLPQQQGHMQREGSSTSGKGKRQALRKQLQTMQRLLGQLQEKFTQVYETNKSEEEVSDETGSTAAIEEDHSTWNERSPDTSTSEVFMDPYSDFQRPFDRVHLGWKKIKLMDYIHSKPDEDGKLLADVLKYELSRAVNSSVDLICKNISHSLLHVEDRGMETDGETLYLSPHKQSSTHEDGMSRLPPCSESLTVQLPDVQTEALSLVVQKPPLTHPRSVKLAVKRPLQLDQPLLLSSHHSPLQEDQVLKNFKHTFGGLQCGSPNMSQFTSGIVDLPWDTIKMRSKVTSTPQSSPQAHPMAVGHVVLDSLCLPHVKMECGTLQSMVKRNSYVLNEGLSTNHLRKAKLMFFHTRYPSSNVLKTFFPDVQFTRCITSQLIKWFSNFREFYYIQMEKFARQARMEGIINVRDLTVDRDSELFRALNMHYNKANDFQVPDRFLEVAEITLQEFYLAISLAKDSDPSWKKAIYKVICKLDSDVPAEFKSPLWT